MVVLKALFICEDLMKIIIDEKILHGKVHSIFNNACNIEAGDKFITLLSSDKKMSPMSVIIGNGEVVNFKKLNLNQSFHFDFCREKIYCLEKDIRITLGEAQRWASKIDKLSDFVSEDKLLENIITLEKILKKSGKFYGMGSLVNTLAEAFPFLELMIIDINDMDENIDFIKRRFVNFIDCVLKRNFENIGDAAVRIIGYGIGLTPSVDDFISGLMISSLYLAAYYKLKLSKVYEFNSGITSLALNKTTKVSSEMLKHSSKGKTTEVVKELMKALLTENNEDIISKALLSSIKYGETSGTDISLGIYFGCKVWTNFNYRRVWLNDTMCRN